MPSFLEQEEAFFNYVESSIDQIGFFPLTFIYVTEGTGDQETKRASVCVSPDRSDYNLS
jgi:hypothetical protein